jgi:predicted transposase/invertase (TIGR01784 family)
VEIQVDKQEHFISRTFYYLCMTISNLAKKGRDFNFNIPKLYSLSFMDFDLDFGKPCTEVVQHLSIRNDLHPEVSYDMLQMTFVILPRFKKKESECKTIKDKLLFSLKNGHKLKKVPKDFRERELKDIFNIAEISNFNSDELRRYETTMMNKYDQRACLAYAEKIGLEKGETRGVLRTAKCMLKNGIKPALVARITKLPKEQIMALSN